MSEGDTIGEVFTAMTTRLIGTLLGNVGDISLDKNQPNFTASVSISNPIVINLHRLPYASQLLGGNYALLRLKENLVGIAIGYVLTVIIFAIFAIDLLKENIQSK